jgi:DNA-binding beta-propeller fold protein YncE
MNKPLRKWVALLAVALVLAACGSSTTKTGGTPTTIPITPTATSATLSPAGTISAMIPGIGAITGQNDGYGMAADSTAVWVYNGETGNLLRIDPKTNQIVATIPVGLGCPLHAPCGEVAIGQGAVWVMAGAVSKLVRVDPQTNHIVATIPFPVAQNPSLNVFVTPGAVWVTDYYDNTIFRIDPQTNKITSVLTPEAGPTGVAFGAGSLWLCEAHNTPGLTRLDPATMQVQAQIDVSGNGQYIYCLGLLALDQGVWVLADDGETVVLERIDPATNKVAATIASFPGTQGTGWTADAQGVWALDKQGGLYRLDPQSGQAVGVVAFSGGIGLTLGAGSVWVTKGDGTLVRITPAS